MEKQYENVETRPGKLSSGKLPFGKGALKERIRPVDGFDDTSCDISFNDWLPEDAASTISYSFQKSRFGKVLIADTPKGVCFLGFVAGGDAEIMADLARRFPGQELKEEVTDRQLLALDRCNGIHTPGLSLHLKGTIFQLAIWKRLVCIPEGSLSTYGSLSGKPGGAQAVGAAVGANPVSYIVPCHRIVCSDGDLRGYRWGLEVKERLLGFELK